MGTLRYTPFVAECSYRKLLSMQEPLGKEFERVLYDNLWDLYDRDDVNLDADAARYTALEDPNIIIRTWR